MTPHHGQAIVVHKNLSGSDTVHMVLKAPWLNHARPGQFIMIRVHAGTAPLLRRPISLSAVTPQGIEILFKIRGTGTRHMALWPVGQLTDIIGPLGHGFDPPRPATPAFLVAGGIGVAPLIGLARWLRDNLTECPVHMLLGAATTSDIDCLVQFVPENCTLETAAEDGSSGHHGFVTDLLTLDKLKQQPQAMVYGCGPMPMLKTLATLSRSAGSPCQISLEAHMACGVGACLGCTVPVHTSDGQKQVRVCADGPVFDACHIFPAQ